jgi:hypothetical protein
MSSILILIESIDPNDSSGTKGRLALINNLIKIGHQVKVLHLDESYNEKPNFDAKVIGRFKSSKYYWLSKLNTFFKKVGIQLNKRVEPKLGFSFSHFEDTERFKIALGKENLQAYDIVLTCSKAASFRPHKALLESPDWHSKWYAYIHDPYPMHSYPRPYDWVEPGHQQKREFFISVFGKAKKLVYPSLLLAEWMESYYHNSAPKRLIIPHQIGEYKISKSNSFFSKQKFSILHAGSLMSARKPHGLIEAFIKLKENHPELQNNSYLLFIGSKSCFHNYFLETQQQHNELVVSDNAIPFNEVLRLQMDTAVNVILEAKGPVSPFLPGKFAHCISSKKPILLLGPYYSESRRILGMEDYPYWSEIDDVEKIYITLEKLYHNWKNNYEHIEYDKIKAYLTDIKL